MPTLSGIPRRGIFVEIFSAREDIPSIAQTKGESTIFAVPRIRSVVGSSVTHAHIGVIETVQIRFPCQSMEEFELRSRNAKPNNNSLLIVQA